MIGETCQQLENLTNQSLTISFVLLPEQQNVYDAFSDRLKQIKISENKITSIPFDKQSSIEKKSESDKLFNSFF